MSRMINWPAILLPLRTLAIALGGGILASFTGIPAGWLSGAMIAVSVAAVARVRVQIPARLPDVVFIVLGTLLGTGVTPDIVSRIGTWPISIVGLLLSLAVMVFAVQEFFVRVAHWDRPTAFFAAVPGALSYVLALATASGANIPRVVVSQSIRIFLLVAAIPALVTAVEPIPAPPPRVAPELVPLVLLLLASGAGGVLLRWLRVPAGLLSGALLVSGIAHATGWISGTLPAALAVAPYVVLGAMIGCRFVGTDIAFLRRIAMASIGAFVVASAVAAVFAFAVAALVNEPIGQILVAFAPGGLDAMTALALALHMDSAFVAVHQLVRFIAIALFSPFVVRGTFGSGGKSQ